jgi:hypothetical protein
MPSRANATLFEQSIARIHSLLEETNSKVTWNDKIPDPDNPTQNRQIDITIINNNLLTLVECRFHKSKQDVKWIEELIGRRQSLNADALIAVSSSGFTKGAINKAKRYGIITRDLTELTKEEVARWGKESKLQVNYVKFTKPKFIFFHDDKGPLYENKELIDITYELLEKTTKNIFDKGEAKGVDIGFSADRLTINDKNIVYVKIISGIKKITKELKTSSVLAYGITGEENLFKDAAVENIDGLAKIEHVGDGNIIILDSSKITMDANTIYHSVELQLKAPLDKKLRMVEIEAEACFVERTIE